jgi:hypothetical protein
VFGLSTRFSSSDLGGCLHQRKGAAPGLSCLWTNDPHLQGKHVNGIHLMGRVELCCSKEISLQAIVIDVDIRVMVFSPSPVAIAG